MSTPPAISIAGIFTGGAAIPIIAPIASIAPVCGAGIPISKSIGATIEPELNTAAVEEPVIIPGNIIISISKISINVGTL
jgi:hypothetical protein